MAVGAPVGRENNPPLGAGDPKDGIVTAADGLAGVVDTATGGVGAAPPGGRGPEGLPGGESPDSMSLGSSSSVSYAYSSLLSYVNVIDVGRVCAFTV